MAKKFLTALNTAEEASILKLYLQSFGIEVEMRDEGTVSAYPLASYALGGVKLYVLAEQWEEAEKHLRKYQAGEIENAHEEFIPVLEGELHDEDEEKLERAEEEVAKNSARRTCPSCGSKQLSRPKLLIFPLLFAIGVIAGLVIRKWGWVIGGAMWWSAWTYLPAYKCRRCGKTP